MNQTVLREATRVEVTVLVDNHTDALVLQSTEVVKRPFVPYPEVLFAEHGLAWLIKVCAGSEEHLLIVDAGTSATCFRHNAVLLKAPLERVEAVALSHGHFDHFGGLSAVFEGVPSGIPLVVHPDAFLERRARRTGIKEPVVMPQLSERALAEAGASLRKVREPSMLAGDLVMMTGQVERVTSFERGMPGAEKKVNDEWMPDALLDDQALVVNVKGRGLVVVAGCSHSGIINILWYARKVTGTARVHAVLGGFHLNGPSFDPIIAPTIEEMVRIGPEYVVPVHCTGWKASTQFAREMPQQFLLNTVGTTYTFQSRP